MNQSWVTPASPLKTRMTGYPRRTVRFGPGVVRPLALRPQPRPAAPYSRIVGGLPSAEETGGEPTMRRAIRRTATTAAALTGDNMQGRNHRIMLQAAELGAVNLVIADLERGEPVDVLVARDHIDLEIEGGDVERVGDVDALEDQLDGAAHFDGEGPGREAQLRVRDGRTGAVGRDEPPGPLLGKHAHREVGIRRDGVRDDERLEGGDSDDDQDDRGNDRPRGLELSVMGLRDGRSRRVPGPHAELQDGVGDQHHDEDADADRWDQHQVEELLRRALSRCNRLLGPPIRRRGREDRQEGRGQEERAPEARHRPAESRGPLKHLWYYANSPCERRSNEIDWKAFCRLAKYGESRPVSGPRSEILDGGRGRQRLSLADRTDRHLPMADDDEPSRHRDPVPRDPRPSHLEEPDAAWCDWSHADLADPEPIPANRVAHGAILGCRWDFDGRARLAPLESGNRRDLQVMKGRPFRAPSGPAYLLTLFKVDMARPWRDVVLARISDVARNESRADGRARCDRRSRTFARLVRREPSRSPLETDPRSVSNPRRRSPPSADSGGQRRSVLRTIPRAVPDRPRPCRGAAGRCARGMGRPRFLPAGGALACGGASHRESARWNGAPFLRGARSTPGHRAVHRRRHCAHCLRPPGARHRWECDAGDCAPFPDSLGRHPTECPPAHRGTRRGPRLGGPSGRVQPGDDGTRRDDLHADFSRMRTMPCGRTMTRAGW